MDKRDAEFRVRFSRAMKAGKLDIPKTSVIHLLGEETGCSTFISIHLPSTNVVSTCVLASPRNPRARVHSIELAKIGISRLRIYPSSQCRPVTYGIVRRTLPPSSNPESIRDSPRIDR